MLRIPMIDPPADPSTMVSAGSTAWSTMSEMNAQVKPGFSVAVP
jgi:hypothetical protein